MTLIRKDYKMTKTSTRQLRLVMTFVIVLKVLPICRAEVLYNNLSTSNGVAGPGLYVPQWFIYEAGSSVNLGIGTAAPFTVTGGSYSLTSVSLVLQHLQDHNNLAISIFSDSGGEPGVTVLETLAVDPSNLSATPQLVTYDSSLTPVLNANTTYWLVVEPHRIQNIGNPSDNAVYGWYENNSFVLGSVKIKNYNFQTAYWDGWRTINPTLLPAFRIEGTLVPEPATFWFLAGGLSWLGFSWRKRRG